MFDGELDPDIADLMGISENKVDESKPTFRDLFGKGTIKSSAEKESVDLKAESFIPPLHMFNKKEDSLFSSSDYYKSVLDGEDEEANRFHKLLSSFIKAKDNQEKSLYRGKLISAYWNLAARFAAQICTNIPKAKRYALRFGLTTPALVKEAARKMVSRIILEKETTEPIFYIDEWLMRVATGSINPSAVDETKAVQSNKQGRLKGQITNVKANLTASKDLIKVKTNNIQAVEQSLKEAINTLTEHTQNHAYPELIDVYAPSQRSLFGTIQQYITQLKSMDVEVGYAFNELEKYGDKLNSIKEQSDGDIELEEVDNKTLAAEFDSVRQMTKMCVGKQGNHMPVLLSPYIRPETFNLGTRENVIKTLMEIEEIDPDIFYRTYKRERYRIVPYIIMTPSYGDSGICWEPFERFNRATSRGRIAVPMYPKDLKVALLTALADLRWQVAKEKAAHYWMEEGLTGGYYQYAISERLKGNIKDYFVKDYILWITKEANGIQKLEKEVRRVFWRHIPFKQELREKLKNRGFAYSNLYKKDINRQLSDGY